MSKNNKKLVTAHACLPGKETHGSTPFQLASYFREAVPQVCRHLGEALESNRLTFQARCGVNVSVNFIHDFVAEPAYVCWHTGVDDPRGHIDAGTVLAWGCRDGHPREWALIEASSPLGEIEEVCQALFKVAGEHATSRASVFDCVFYKASVARDVWAYGVLHLVRSFDVAKAVNLWQAQGFDVNEFLGLDPFNDLKPEDWRP